MRRYIYLLLFVLSVCGGMVTSCSRHEVRFRIGVSQCSDDEWRHQMNNEMLREALFYDGVEVEIRTVKDDNARQAEDIRHFIEAGVDLLIVAPNEAEPHLPGHELGMIEIIFVVNHPCRGIFACKSTFIIFDVLNIWSLALQNRGLHIRRV